MNDDIKKEELFFSGLNAYSKGEYFDAHEIWEELWSDYYLKDKDFIPVSYTHLTLPTIYSV